MIELIELYSCVHQNRLPGHFQDCRTHMRRAQERASEPPFPGGDHSLRFVGSGIRWKFTSIFGSETRPGIIGRAGDAADDGVSHLMGRFAG